ncbi:MAG: hypothetical protein EPN56_09330 [Rhodanobacter sp.]|nr:MAG: hypothetical protein EPN78_05325 [Rhodanobacter sp.]TAM13491.1 MAG: hypothetical protein EPN66_04255 [Rhodanobacter sp.]TAM35756.1 MAG: hypothetical protein EPN56_09330 [Rhodanobacter sp.]
MPESDHYPIRAWPWRTQLRDTYRVLFVPVTLAVVASATRFFHWPWGLALGACLGMLPSYVLGTPSRMPIAPGDSATIDHWLAAHKHVHDARGWVPRLPRNAYFDS